MTSYPDPRTGFVPHTTEHRVLSGTFQLQYRTRLEGSSDWSQWLDGDYGIADCVCKLCKSMRGSR